MKRGLRLVVLVSLLVVLLSLSVSAASNFSAQAGFDWLAVESDEGLYDDDTFATSFAILALDAAGYDTSLSEEALYTLFNEGSGCWSTSSCTVQETAGGVLALNAVQDDLYFDEIESWFLDSLGNADLDGGWYLEVVTDGTGSCTISYELGDDLVEVEVSVEEGTFPDCGDSYFLDLDECVVENLISNNPGITLDVDCGEIEDSVVLTLLYRSASTYYLIGNENSANADFSVNNGCYGKTSSGACDMESTEYAMWALDTLGSTVSTLVYLKEDYDSSDPTSVALMYMATSDEGYLEDLVDLQKSDGSFDRSVFTTALGVLALSGESATYSAEIDDAKSYLREEQDDEGHWGGSVVDTSIALYAAFAEDDIEASSCDDGEQNGAEDGVDCGGACDSCDEDELVSECDADGDCEELYGEGYVCDDGYCEEEGSSDAECSVDDDCASNPMEVCVDDYCVRSDCDYKGTCDWSDDCLTDEDDCEWFETASNCASDCYCGDGVWDGYEQESDSCDEDNPDAEDEDEDDDSSSTTTDDTSDEDSGSSSIFLLLFLLIILAGLGGGGYFAYKRGYLDTILARFKKGGKGPVAGGQPYTPFSSRLPPQQPRPGMQPRPVQPRPLGGVPPRQPGQPFRKL